MSNSKAFSEAVLEDGQPAAVGNTVLKDCLALIKVGIVNSNAMTTFTGLWLALHFSGAHFLDNIDLILVTLIGSSLIVAGSCSLNNYIDRDIDHLIERTKGRPTVTGRVQPGKVALMSFLLIGAGTAFLLTTTLTAVVIGLIGVFSYVVLYTMWSKRQYVSNTIVGSISGAVPPLIGWAAVDANLDVMAWMLFAIVFVWQPPHFYALAMRRVEEYRAAGIPMLPVVKGFKATKRSIFLWVTALLPLPFFLPSDRKSTRLNSSHHRISYAVFC